MEKWPSGWGAGLPNQRFQVQKHKMAEKLPQLSYFKVNLINIKDSWGLRG